MKEFKKKCIRCGAEYVTTGAASKYCTDCREIVIKEMKRKQYEKDKEFYKNKVQRCICCGKDFKSTRKRAFCISCGKLTEEERRDLMTIKDSVTRADFRTGAENAYYREDGVLVLPCNEKRKRKRRSPKGSGGRHAGIHCFEAGEREPAQEEARAIAAELRQVCGDAGRQDYGINT